MINNIDERKLINKSEIAIGQMLEGLSDSVKPAKMRHYIGDVMSGGKKYVFKIEAELRIENFKVGNRIHHEKYGDGTVSVSCGAENGGCYHPDGNVSITFDADIPKYNKRMSVCEKNITLI